LPDKQHTVLLGEIRNEIKEEKTNKKLLTDFPGKPVVIGFPGKAGLFGILRCDI
jgi:hypothetical protein